MNPYLKALVGLMSGFLFWLAALGAIVWYEAGATIEQHQTQEDTP